MDIIHAAQLESNCPKSHFVCANKKCVSGLLLCNGYDDCGDRSDETIGCTGREMSHKYTLRIGNGNDYPFSTKHYHNAAFYNILL